jgi:hypothetical protein
MPGIWGRFCHPCKISNRISGTFLPPLQKSQPNLRQIIAGWNTTPENKTIMEIFCDMFGSLILFSYLCSNNYNLV